MINQLMIIKDSSKFQKSPKIIAKKLYILRLILYSIKNDRFERPEVGMGLTIPNFWAEYMNLCLFLWLKLALKCIFLIYVSADDNKLDLKIICFACWYIYVMTRAFKWTRLLRWFLEQFPSSGTYTTILRFEMYKGLRLTGQDRSTFATFLIFKLVFLKIKIFYQVLSVKPWFDPIINLQKWKNRF